MSGVEAIQLATYNLKRLSPRLTRFLLSAAIVYRTGAFIIMPEYNRRLLVCEMI